MSIAVRDKFAAVLLAAGYGTRLERDVRADRSGHHLQLLGVSKALVPVSATDRTDTVLSRWLAQLRACDDLVDATVLVTNRAHVAQFQSADVFAGYAAKVRVVDDGSESNADRLGAVADLLLAVDADDAAVRRSGAHLLVIAGDTLFYRDFQLRSVLCEFQRLRAEAHADAAFGVVLFYELADHAEVSKRGIIEHDEATGRVRAFLEKPQPEATTSNKAVPAFYVYSRECVALLDEFVASTPRMEARDAPGTFLQWLIPRGVPTYAVRISGRYDIGGLADLEAARAHLAAAADPPVHKSQKERAGLAFEQLVCAARGIASTPHALLGLNRVATPAPTDKNNNNNKKDAAAPAAAGRKMSSSYDDIDDDIDDSSDGKKSGGGARAATPEEDAGMREKLRQKKMGAHLHFQTNLYELLGLGDVGEDATPADLKKAYRAMVLQYHPDKNTEIDDDIFKKIQDAYDTLSDPVKKQEYDSQIPFDDSLPPASLEPGEDFFKEFAPFFRRNAKWSVAQPVPQLGDATTPIAKVLKFYEFWEAFKSWRSWPHLNEFDLNTADGRDERRWMERKNEAIQAKKKKAEKTRFNDAITRARKNDPRIIAYAAEEQDRKKSQKSNKQNKPKSYNRAKEPQRADITAVSSMPASARPASTPPRAASAAASPATTPVAAQQPPRAASASPTSAAAAAAAAAASPAPAPTPTPAAASAAPAAAAAPAPAATPASAPAPAPEAEPSEGKPWTADDLVVLAKAVAKFPPGVRNRWEQMQTLLPDRSVKEIINRTKQIAAESDARRLAERGIAVPDAFASSQAKAKTKTAAAGLRSEKSEKAQAEEIKVTMVAAQAPAAAHAPAAAAPAAAAPAAAADAAAAAAAAPAAEVAEGADWTPEQQQLLEEALKLFPGPGKERWTGISQHVGRSRKDCVERFKFCVSLLATGDKPTPQ